MLFAWSRLCRPATLALLAFTVACSTGSGAAPCGQGGADDAGVCTAGQTQSYVSCADLTTPVVSYRQTIQPVFNASCGVSSPGMCHAKQPANTSTKYLIYMGGGADAGVDASEVLAALVNVTAQEDPQMKLVAPGDPGGSYLMHKLDGDQCQFAAACDATRFPLWSEPTPCGATMPYTAAQLPTDVRDQVRRWIAQGAKNN